MKVGDQLGALLDRSPARMDPCVEVAVFAPGASSPPRKRTAPVVGNGFNPIFPEPAFALPFEVVGGMLDLVFVRFQVFDGDPDDTAMGRYCIPVGCLAPGAPRALPFFAHG